MTKKSNRKTRDVYRSADDGRFITKKQADRKPKESVKERMKK